MKVGKPQSKRVPVRLRHKIQKASASKQRKQRKEAKKNPQWRSRLKKDPGVPNLFPYKAKVLAEMEENKRRKEEEQVRRRDVAKAQREGRVVGEVERKEDGVVEVDLDEEGDEVLLDEENVEEDEQMEEAETGNPMAALLASAQARADAFTQPENDDEVSDDDEDDEWDGIADTMNSSIQTTQHKNKALPKQALADPIKAVSALLDRMQQTQDGIQRIIDHYNVPPLVIAGSDLTSRFLVEVARKRGRLGRGGVPNLHSAALTVLGDLNEERLVLPAVESVKQLKVIDRGGKGEVKVVTQLAEPFKIEGLWGDVKGAKEVVVEETEMVEESQ